MKAVYGLLVVFLMLLGINASHAFAQVESTEKQESMDNQEDSYNQSMDNEEEADAMASEEDAAVLPVVSKSSSEPKAINYGDYRSTTLVTKAWEALDKNDIDGVLAYTNKCIELYAEQAKKMQGDLKDYPAGSNDDIFKFWALNDVGTSYYIQGESYRKANMIQESKDAFNALMENYSFAQTWDPKGWFWKPVEAAKEKLAMMDAGVSLDFGDYSSSQLVQKSWAALAAKDKDAVIAYVKKLMELYSTKAKDMQTSLKEYSWESKEQTMSYWALNDVGTGLFILGETYRVAGNKEEAAQAYKQLIDDYFYAQCWDPQGWFWKPAEAAQQKLAELDNV